MQPVQVSTVNVDMKENSDSTLKSCPNIIQQLSVMLLLLSLLSSVQASELQPYPEFTAVFDAKISGISMGEVSFSLRKLDNGEYLYQRKATSVGIASLLGQRESTAKSRWRYGADGIKVMEFKSSDEDGDADDNLHLIFDWQTAEVKNVSPADPWQTEMPTGTLDKLAMQLAILFELRDGKTEFQYPVAHEGRIKQYWFKQVGREKLELELGDFDTLIVERLKEDRDVSRIWIAPDLNYFPVRFLKLKQDGAKRELLLREVKFSGQGTTG